MYINTIGIITFIFFAYSLVFGRFYFPQLSLHGLALATIIQYLIMNSIAIAYIVLNPDYKKYFSGVIFSVFSMKKALQIIHLSWPIIIDKTCFAAMSVWLSKALAGISTNDVVSTTIIASYDVVKNLERSAFVSAIAFAQIATFLVSNQLGAHDHEGASSTIKKILLLALVTVSGLLIFLCYNANFFVAFFDPKKSFTSFAATALPCISALAIFDLVQVILAGSLRGAGDVKSVMWIRFCVFIFFFIPLTYCINLLPITNLMVKFILMYSSYYLSAGVMAGFFLKRILSHKWQKTEI